MTKSQEYVGAAQQQLAAAEQADRLGGRTEHLYARANVLASLALYYQRQEEQNDRLAQKQAYISAVEGDLAEGHPS